MTYAPHARASACSAAPQAACAAGLKPGNKKASIILRWFQAYRRKPGELQSLVRGPKTCLNRQPTPKPATKAPKLSAA